MEIKSEEYKDYLNEEYLTMKEAAALLDVTEEELATLVAKHQVPTHSIAGAFLRIKKKDIEELKNRWRIKRELFPKPARYFSHNDTVRRATFVDKFKDFWYFNDFYIICTILIVTLIYFIITSQ